MNPFIRPTTIYRTEGVRGFELKANPWPWPSPPSSGVSSISIVSLLFYAFMPMKLERLQKSTTFIILKLFNSALYCHQLLAVLLPKVSLSLSTIHYLRHLFTIIFIIINPHKKVRSKNKKKNAFIVSAPVKL